MEPEELLQQQRDRFELASSRAEAKVDQIKPNANVGRLLVVAGNARKALARVRWLHRAASAWAASIEPFSACRRGCNHCCHIPVVILSTEARLLSLVTGRTIAQPAQGLVVRDAMDTSGEHLNPLPDVQEKHFGKPCPFLLEGACSVYEDRPLVCRTQLNLDDDDLLCRLTPHGSTRVPYADNTMIQAVGVGLFLDDTLADIRDFFPAG